MAKAPVPLTANGVRLQDGQEPATNQELGAVGAMQKMEKGEKTWVRPCLLARHASLMLLVLLMPDGRVNVLVGSLCGTAEGGRQRARPTAVLTLRLALAACVVCCAQGCVLR